MADISIVELIVSSSVMVFTSSACSAGGVHVCVDRLTELAAQQSPGRLVCARDVTADAVRWPEAP